MIFALIFNADRASLFLPNGEGGAGRGGERRKRSNNLYPYPY